MDSSYCIVCQKACKGLTSLNGWTMVDGNITATPNNPLGAQVFCETHMPEPVGRVASLEEWPQ
jgi:hypothetical protein